MPWPGVTDFTAAIQNPDKCFKDSELSQGRPSYSPRNGLPMVYSGNFASVYPISSRNRKLGVRCFTREVKNQAERYGHLSDYLRQQQPPGFVHFEFQADGIRVKGQWYPIIKMEWVEGQSLDKYTDANHADPGAIGSLATRWRESAHELQSRNIAHNDLQHGNVMVRNDGSIRLVDYDGFYLPIYQGQSSPETGHQNFQHPRRTSDHYAHWIDNFPALVVYVSLLAIAADRKVWEFHNADNLIFTRSDYREPSKSECFATLRASPNPDVQALTKELERFCEMDVAMVPTLEEILSPTSTRSLTYYDLLQERQGAPTGPTPDSVPDQRSTSERETAAEAKLLVVRGELQVTQGELQLARKRATDAGRTIKDLKTELAALERDLETELAAREGELENAQSTIDTLDHEVQAMRIELETSRQNAKAAQSELQFARKRATDAERTVRDLGGELQAAQSKLQLAERRDSRSNTLIGDLQTELAARRSGLDNAQSTIDTLNHQVQAMQGELQAARQNAEESQKKADSAEAKYQAAVVLCPRCRKPNLGHLITCYDETCSAPLHGDATCRSCSGSIPARAKFCPICGVPLSKFASLHSSRQ